MENVARLPRCRLGWQLESIRASCEFEQRPKQRPRSHRADEVSISADRLTWVPEGLEPVALRLARSDARAYEIGDLASKWSLDGPLDFDQVRCGAQVQMTVKSVRPVPPEASLLFSEGVNHLRAAVDNVVWYLVEQEIGTMSGSLASVVSMPITESSEDMDKWTRRRNKISAFSPGSQLGRRLRALQPFIDVHSAVPSMGEALAGILGTDVESAHPLRLLQAYSNADKHRSIRIAAARTFSSSDGAPLAQQNLAPQELKVGDPVGPATTWGQVAIMETNTALMVRRPEPFFAWVNPVKELNAMRRHLSQVVIPILLTGLEMPRGLPPKNDLQDNGQSSRERLSNGSWDDAETRLGPLLSTRYREAESRELQFPPVTRLESL